jgi:hypothetical protein
MGLSYDGFHEKLHLCGNFSKNIFYRNSGVYKVQRMVRWPKIGVLDHFTEKHFTAKNLPKGHLTETPFDRTPFDPGPD